MIVCDLDGCIFDNNHRKHLIPKNLNNPLGWNKFNQACANDGPILAVISFVKFLSKHRNDEQCQKIVFLTSRGEDSRSQTEKQLFRYFYQYNCTLIMRAMNDHRDTVDYKREMLHKLSDGFSHDSIIIDDHPGVIKMASITFPQINRMLVPSFDCTVTNNKAS